MVAVRAASAASAAVAASAVGAAAPPAPARCRHHGGDGSPRPAHRSRRPAGRPFHHHSGIAASAERYRLLLLVIIGWFGRVGRRRAIEHRLRGRARRHAGHDCHGQGAGGRVLLHRGETRGRERKVDEDRFNLVDENQLLRGACPKEISLLDEQCPAIPLIGALIVVQPRLICAVSSAGGISLDRSSGGSRRGGELVGLLLA